MEQKINEIIKKADSIVVVQADNPDADSLASSLALEQIFEDMGKKVTLYCGVSMPSYLRYLPGWDRVEDTLPKKFDASVIVDTNALTLLEQLKKNGLLDKLSSKPVIVIDHHTDTKEPIDFAEVSYIMPAVATSEVIYELSNQLKWQRNEIANDMLMTAIMADSLGLTSEGTTARSIHVVAELVDQGVNIAKLDNMRRVMMKKSPQLLQYKAELLKRIEYNGDQQIASITIPWEEIEKYSHEYNPSLLVLDEMRFIENVAIAIAFKTYPDGRITAKLRSNYGYGICSDLAKQFGGGGHPYAAGFKVTGDKSYAEIKSETIKKAEALLATINKDSDETTQYAYTAG